MPSHQQKLSQGPYSTNCTTTMAISIYHAPRSNQEWNKLNPFHFLCSKRARKLVRQYYSIGLSLFEGLEFAGTELSGSRADTSESRVDTELRSSGAAELPDRLGADTELSCNRADTER